MSKGVAPAVQIPLWTIVTDGVDKFPDTILTVQIPLWTIVTIFSRSTSPSTSGVQIPLWTIVTSALGLRKLKISRSDSSMDDCNKAVL